MNIYISSVEIRKLLSKRSNRSETHLTTDLIDLLSENRHIRAYLTTQRFEGQTSGADCLWVILTDHGAYRFLLQAKKISSSNSVISKSQAYVKNNKNRQIDLLLSYSKKVGATPLYLLFSDQIDQVECASHPHTDEGVFIDSALNVYKHFFVDEEVKLRHMPISCMFACYSRNCHYSESDDIEKRCIACRKCKLCQSSSISKYGHYEEADNCKVPFNQFFRTIYGISCYPVNINDKMLLTMFADSIIARNPKFIPYILENGIWKKDAMLKNVIITDYVNRHGQNYMSILLGREFRPSEEVLDLNFICSVILKYWKKYPIFFDIGIFGSYRKGDAHAKSDIDIALVYNSKIIKSEKELDMIIGFIKDISLELKKNIDFIDYLALSNNRDSAEFREDISADMLWLKGYNAAVEVEPQDREAAFPSLHSTYEIRKGDFQ